MICPKRAARALLTVTVPLAVLTANWPCSPQWAKHSALHRQLRTGQQRHVQSCAAVPYPWKRLKESCDRAGDSVGRVMKSLASKWPLGKRTERVDEKVEQETDIVSFHQPMNSSAPMWPFGKRMKPSGDHFVHEIGNYSFRQPLTSFFSEWLFGERAEDIDEKVEQDVDNVSLHQPMTPSTPMWPFGKRTKPSDEHFEQEICNDWFRQSIASCFSKWNFGKRTKEIDQPVVQETSKFDEQETPGVSSDVNRRLSIEVCDITCLHVDGIVNAANERMLGGGGVDGAIHMAAGPELRKACEDFSKAFDDVRCPIGEARITRGFKLPAKHVIHTVGPRWMGGTHHEERLLRRAYASALTIAAEMHMDSVAFPCISTGIFGYPAKSAAKVAVQEICQLLSKNEYPKSVTLCAYSEEAAKPLRSAMKQQSFSPHGGSHGTSPLACVVYHYTSMAGKKGIEAVGRIEKSVPYGADSRQDAVYGPGVYVTDLAPRFWRSRRCIQWTTGAISCEHAARLILPENKLIKARDHVYVFQDHVYAEMQLGGEFEWVL